ncbi:hypothetical protein WA026_012322 [Henosepilachna vigintioctopunctata]|uniref:Uncharacterized protein n=1 Tax=Henosepilachna vigintioctopunctata TaxID=420089 RepID=A0AAW1V133_9CUCU
MARLLKGNSKAWTPFLKNQSNSQLVFQEYSLSLVSLLVVRNGIRVYSLSIKTIEQFLYRLQPKNSVRNDRLVLTVLILDSEKLHKGEKHPLYTLDYWCIKRSLGVVIPEYKEPLQQVEFYDFNNNRFSRYYQLHTDASKSSSSSVGIAVFDPALRASKFATGFSRVLLIISLLTSSPNSQKGSFDVHTPNPRFKKLHIGEKHPLYTLDYCCIKRSLGVVIPEYKEPLQQEEFYDFKNNRFSRYYQLHTDASKSSSSSQLV